MIDILRKTSSFVLISLFLLSNLGRNAAIRDSRENEKAQELKGAQIDAKNDEFSAIWPEQDAKLNKRNIEDRKEMYVSKQHPITRQSNQLQDATSTSTWSGLDQLVNYLAGIVKIAATDSNPRRWYNMNEETDMFDAELAAGLAEYEKQNQDNSIMEEQSRKYIPTVQQKEEFRILSSTPTPSVDACGEVYAYDSSSGVAKGSDFKLEQGFPPMRHPNCSRIGYLYREKLYETRCNETLTNITSCINGTCTNTTISNTTCAQFSIGYANGTCICPIDRVGATCESYRQFNCSVDVTAPVRRWKSAQQPV